MIYLLKNAKECHCGKFEVDASFLPAERCNLKCQGKRCGGDSVFSIYIGKYGLLAMWVVGHVGC